MNNSQIFEIVLSAIPYANQINDIDFTQEGVIRFSWRSSRYRVDENLHVEEIEGSFLTGTDKAMLFRELLKKTKLIKEF